MLTPLDVPALERLALKVREHVVRLATNGGCFLGASLSCADLLVYLYSRVLRVAPDRVTDPDRDYLLLSKGHDVPALYATLAELGFFDPARLGRHLEISDHLYWHPHTSVPGIEFHSGSLGHLLPVALGVAYDIRLRRGNGRVFVVVGDGELNEGSVWEALLVGRAKRLENLVVVVDRNGLQANVRTEDLIPLEPLGEKFAAFGWGVSTVDGHDFTALDRAFRALPVGSGAPSVVIATTVRGKGLPSVEGRADRWFCDFNAAEIEALVAELHGAAAGELVSQPLMVR